MRREWLAEGLGSLLLTATVVGSATVWVSPARMLANDAPSVEIDGPMPGVNGNGAGSCVVRD